MRHDVGHGQTVGASRYARIANGALRAAAIGLLGLVGIVGAAAPPIIPSFTHSDSASWLNSAPLDTRTLRGRPILLEFWAFECSNCIASLPWMHRVEERYRKSGLAIVGIHSPELARERDAALVAEAIQRFKIDYPVMLDSDFSYWRRLDNHYWPAFYLFDAAGRLLATRIGELHAGEPEADSFEQLIAAQLALPAAR